MSIDYQTVGLRIRRYRTERGITQEELAFRVHTSSSYISHVENAHKRPSLEKIIEISEALGVTVNDLLYPASLRSDYADCGELNEMLSLLTPEKQDLIIEHISSFIRSIIMD